MNWPQLTRFVVAVSNIAISPFAAWSAIDRDEPLLMVAAALFAWCGVVWTVRYLRAAQ